jgi:hypothetical protein
VALASDPAIVSSPDAANWTRRLSGAPDGLVGIGYANGGFVAVGGGYSINSTIMTSAEGTNWVNRYSGPTNEVINGVTYGNGQYLAVGENGTIVGSLDGTNWVQRQSGTQSVLYGVTYASSQFVAVGDAGIILGSVDGSNWVQRESGTAGPKLSGIAYGNGLFVVVGDVILTSADGTHWVQQASQQSGPLSAIAYGNGYFVAVGVGSSIVTSADGVNWTRHAHQYFYPNLHGVAYGDGHFVAFGDYGTILESGSIVTIALTPSVRNGLFTLSLTGPRGLAYTIESSSDLVSWQTVTNIVPAQSTTVISDSLPAASDHVFYHAYGK